MKPVVSHFAWKPGADLEAHVRAQRSPDELGERPARDAPARALRLGRQHALVVARHDLHERLLGAASRRGSLAAYALPRERHVARDQLAHESPVLVASSGSRSTMPRLQRCANVPSLIEHVGDAAAHAGGEIAARPAEHDDPTAGHVFAAVIADAFDHGTRAAVAHGEPLAGHAAQVRLAARRAVQRDVADDDVFFGHERRICVAETRRACRPTALCRSSRWRRLRASA